MGANSASAQEQGSSEKLAQEVSPEAASNETGSSSLIATRSKRLAWVEDPDLTCEGFLEQIRARFGVFGPNIADIPPTLRGDLDTVLGIACSRQFRHCEFESCNIEVSLDEESRNKLVKIREEAQLRVRKHLDESIGRAVQNEKRGRLSWGRFSVPRVNAGNEASEEVEESRSEVDAESNREKRLRRQKMFKRR